MRPRLTKPPVREGQGEEKDADLWPLLYPAGLTREWQWALGTGVFAVNGMVYGVLLIPFGYIPRSLLRTIFLPDTPQLAAGSFIPKSVFSRTRSKEIPMGFIQNYDDLPMNWVGRLGGTPRGPDAPSDRPV